ncbi:MAG: hypothetical protein ACK41V_18480 [Acidovorax sp.]|uniref:hypothetical protein n=1 Tax=Acidovorax sp. TaxID=1872122 RepID=UPI00391A62F6
MNSTAIQILLALEKHGELTLEEISKIIPKIHGDHRDFYVLASLIKRGLVDDPWIPDEKTNQSSGHASKEQLLAWKLFAMSNAEKSASYKNHSYSIHGNGETLKGQIFSMSGLGEIAISEARTKRFDRAFSIGSGILIGIVVALAAVLIERYAKSL